MRYIDGCCIQVLYCFIFKVLREKQRAFLLIGPIGLLGCRYDADSLVRSRA